MFPTADMKEGYNLAPQFLKQQNMGEPALISRENSSLVWVLRVLLPCGDQHGCFRGFSSVTRINSWEKYTILNFIDYVETGHMG